MTNPCTSNEAEQESRVPPPLRYIEFYAGIGGWSLALQQVVQHRRLECCAAWDHSDLCVRVCQHNGLSVCRQQRIELITVVPVADVWVLSPPCQPHTRQHTHQDAELQDSRSQSFLHICRLLQEQPLQNKRPRCILLENVVGFEASQSCRVYWRRAVHGYVLAHFHLTPTQVGMPNDRPRYYCVAVQRDCWAATTAPWAAYFNDDPERDSNQKKDASFTVHTSLPELGVVPIDHVDLTKIPTISTFLDDDSTNTDSLIIPPAVLQRSSSWCLDIVAPTSRRSSCFTSGYGKYMRGTGSVLLLEEKKTGGGGDTTTTPSLQDPHDRQFDPQWAAGLGNATVRYFSGAELTRLMGLASSSFSFPPDCTTKQQWKLVGNSVHVDVVAKIVQLGLLAMGENPG